MNIIFANRLLKEAASDRGKAIRQWGPDAGKRYGLRITQLANAPSFQALHTVAALRLHKLTGDRKDTYSITLHGRWRIVVSCPSAKEIRVEEVTNHYGD
ncbi:MAG: type II toxin-antitoxin system RelE/ParE family toxin [Dehalococcoidia bacterium]